MDIVAYVVVSLLSMVLDVLLVIMLISAIMSWIAPAANNPIMNFVNGITGVLVRPARALLMRFEFVRSFPLDLSFYLTSVVLVLLRSFLRSLL